MEDVINEISSLRLDCLEESWVQAICYSEYLEYSDIPDEYDAVLSNLEVSKFFRNIMKVIRTWQNEENVENTVKSWAVLSRQVPYNKLLALLGYYINHGTKNVTIKEHRNKAILASRLYFRLLSIPGFKSYHIYHSQLFVNSLGCLGFPKAMCDKDNSYSTKELTRQVNSVIKELRDFVLDLRAMIEELQLNPSELSYEDILSNLVDITGGAIVNKLDVDKIELAKISRVIYEMIDILVCDSNREPNEAAILLLFKCILPKLIAASTDTKNANNLVRASYVTYSGLLLSKYGKAAINGYTVLLEHLCYTLDGLEKAEVRAARVSLVVGLMSLLPKKSYKKMVKWLIKLSETAKISHRHIAMEMLSKLLENEPEEVKQQENTAKELEKVAENILPENGAHYNEAENNPSEIIGAENNLNENNVADNNATNNPDSETNTDNNADESENNVNLVEKMTVDAETPNQPEPVVTDDDNTQDFAELRENFEEDPEDEVAGLLRARPHTVPLPEVLRAIYERVDDVSSTLRSRALNILTDCVASRRHHMIEAIKELSGTGEVSRLTALGARCACDERAAVRRAAVALLHRLLAGGPPPAASDLSMLVGLCRDASIIVRSAAISALGEMVVERPSDAMFDAFLTGPMHQLSDPETKVQEQVMNLVQQLLIDRLKKYSPVGCDDNLPWMFLAAVTRNNMRRHLQKACALLAKKNNSVSVRLIDMVSTHLGTDDDERNLHTLVLLTSAARYVDYSDVNFILDYYYTLADDLKEHDNRIMALTLELLSTWSRFGTTQQRTKLREHLVERLANGIDDGCRIATATLAAQLDPTNLQWATELMQLSERRALGGGEVSEWLRAADLSLVADAPPSPALLQLFLATLTPPIQVEERIAGECVAGAGRVSLRSRAAAELAAPALAALLPAATEPLAARVNALLVLTDICTRYTCIVEPLLGCVCGCLGAETPAELRVQAARSITSLLLAGYLRLRTPLYYRYCALLADEDHDVREPAEYYVTCCLTPDTIYHHFVDCVLHYNLETSDAPLSFDARQLIYDVMLQRLTIVQKLNVQCRLAREILEHAADIVDEGDEIPASLHAALLDTITLLCGPRMKLPKKPEKPGEDIDDLQERVTTNIVSHKMKVTVAEVLVPAVLRLFARLAPSGGQIAVYLVRIANDLLEDYRPEIEELIENDEELIGKVRHFQETIGQEPSFGNARNLVTTSAPPEPDTPRAPRRRPAKHNRSPVRKRALRI